MTGTWTGGCPGGRRARSTSIKGRTCPMRSGRTPLAAVTALLILTCPLFTPAASAQVRRGGDQPMAGVYKARVEPHWFHNNTRFWYRNDLRGGTREFILVDATAATRKPAFDHQRLAAALSKTAGKDYRADRLPFDSIEFPEDE